MTDDLVKRLRSPENVFYEYAADDGALLQEAADCIEELEGKLTWVLVERDETFALMLDRVQTAEAKLATCEKYRSAYAEMGRIGTQAVRELDAKLAKAVEVLGIALRYNTAMHGGAAAFNQRIKDTIAELTGGEDD